jgi:FixJ family two-component response regulator
MKQTGPTVFVVDDDPSVLELLDRLIRSAGYAVEAFASPTAFLERACHEGPGCIVLDLCMPEIGGLAVQAAFRNAGHVLPIVFMSGHSDVTSAVQALKAGALDFLTKPFNREQLLTAVERAIASDQTARAEHAEHEALRSRFDALTPRERQVCTLVAAGRLNKQIASELGTSEKTIKVHRGRVMRKLDVGSVAELVRLVDRLGPK